MKRSFGWSGVFSIMVLVSVRFVVNDAVMKDWTIVEPASGLSLNQFYTDLIDGVIDPDWKWEGKEEDILTASVGQSPSKLQKSVLSVQLDEITTAFGRYVNFSIRRRSSAEGKSKFVVGETDSDCCQNDTQSSKNAFDILMQKRKVLPGKSSCIQRTRKHDLWDDFIDFLEEKSCYFYDREIGDKFVKAVVEVLWYIDPHHTTLQMRGCHLPVLFSAFSGYNLPEKSKHVRKQLDRFQLRNHCEELELYIDMPFMKKASWKEIRTAMSEVSGGLYKYTNYLNDQLEKTHRNHGSEAPVRGITDHEEVVLIKPRLDRKFSVVKRYRTLTEKLKETEEFVPFQLLDYVPQDTIQRRHYINGIPLSMTCHCVLFRVAYGNNIGTINFMWKIDNGLSDGDILQKNTEIMLRLQSDLPIYHTRAMHKKFISTCSLMTSTMKPCVLRHIYRCLTGDESASINVNQQEVDKRVREAFEMEDPDILYDLRAHNPGRPPVYEEFFEKAQQYLQNVVETAPCERRHDLITHMATAISLPDLLAEITKTCGPETPIPTQQWLWLQFSPKRPSSISSLQHTGKLDVKYAVQSRQFRSEHPDTHYAAALFRYEKEFAVKYKRYVDFVCEDDKHHIKVGEPGNAVAAVDRGRRVITAGGVKFAVSDHDFTRWSVIPSVIMSLDIPETIDGSFYRGQVYVGVKDLVLEPSSPLRHTTELLQVLEENDIDKPVLLMYADGGPDHRCTYMSVQLSLLCLFLERNYDLLILVRTPPKGSWRNPPERIMSLLNLALQCVGLERGEMEPQFETIIRSCGGIKDLRAAAKKSAELKEAMGDSIESVKVLLNQMFARLKLKDKPVKTFSATTDDSLKELWNMTGHFDEAPIPIDNLDQKSLQKALDARPKLKAFFNHCALQRQYMFSLKKCGKEDCELCPNPRLPQRVFDEIHHLPDPVPGNDDHFHSFDDVYGTETTEKFRPSLNNKAGGSGIPFNASGQTANNVQVVFKCTECNKPRVLYSLRKLKFDEKVILERIGECYDYSCGSVLQDLKTSDGSTPVINALFEKVYVRSSNACFKPIEIPYFSAMCFPDICMLCASDDDLLSGEEANGYYTVCNRCFSTTDQKDKLLRRKRNLHSTGPTGNKRGRKT